MSDTISIQGLSCPVPLAHTGRIVMGHGSGGVMSHDLVTRIFMPFFDNPTLRESDDAGVVQPNVCTRLAISTDSHVVWPLFFPGGDIGRLAVCGTVNDVAMMGAAPQYLTAGFILEEGLELAVLERVARSMQTAAAEAGVQIVAGDTKVVQKGKADGMYITTTGVGVIPQGIQIGGALAVPGDKIILSGPIGDHGIAVLAARGELGFAAEIVSDTAPLNHMIAAMLDTSNNIHVLRDPTRGGLATSLNEIARQSDVGIRIHETSIPVRPAVSAACEMLGFDPMYIANEGKLIAVVGSQDADEILATIRRMPYGGEAVIIGEVTPEPRRRVLMTTAIGTNRIVDMLAGEILPRIC